MIKIWKKEHLALRLGISLDTLETVCRNFHKHCTMSTFKKKDGKVRNIVKTTSILKNIQKRILERILDPLPISQCAHGGVKGCSIKTNAAEHINNKYWLCLDLKSCFPNIHSSRIRKFFEENLKCSPEVSSILTRLTTFNYQLAQGFSTSSALLNLICNLSLDVRIAEFTSQKQLSYSRYVDDITISGEYISDVTRKKLCEIIISEGFFLKKSKEIFSDGKKHVVITGVNVMSKTLKVPNTFKKNLRAEEHNLKKTIGLPQSEKKRMKRSIEGKKQYIEYIEH